MKLFKKCISFCLALVLCLGTGVTALASEGEYKQVVISMSSNITDKTQLWGFYSDNILYVSVEDLCEISGYSLIEETEYAITLGNGGENSTRIFSILPYSDEMLDALFYENWTVKMPVEKIGNQYYVSALHFLNYIGVSYVLNPDSDPQLICVKSYDIHDALVDSLSQWNYFSWDEVEFASGSAENDLTWAGVVALISQDSNLVRMVFDAKGIYRDDLENDMMMVVTNEGTDWLAENTNTSDLSSLINSSYDVSFNWFDFIKGIYAPSGDSTFATVLDSISKTGKFITTGGTILQSNIDAIDTIIQYSNLTDTQKTLLQNTLIEHAEDSEMVAEDDFWKIMLEAAENVNGRVQSEANLQHDTSLKAITDIAYAINNAANGASIMDGNPVTLAWKCMTWSLNLIPEVDQAVMLHNAYNCSMIQQAANQLFVSAYSDLYYNNFYYNDGNAQREALEYLKSALILQLKATLTTRECLIKSGTISDDGKISELKEKCQEVAQLLNQTENCTLNGPNMFSSEYDDDISWMSECEPSPDELYSYVEDLLAGASFDVEIDGVMHADFQNHEDIEFSKKMSVAGYGTDGMSGSGTYKHTGGSVGTGDTAFDFTYACPNMTKHYTSPYNADYTVSESPIDLTMPFVAHISASSVEYQEDNTAVITLQYDGSLMNKYTCGMISGVLPDGYRIYWSPNEEYADMDGIISATIQAKVDENYNPVSIEVSYALNGAVQDIARMEGTTTFTFSNIVRSDTAASSPEAEEKVDVTGVWLQTDKQDPMFLSLDENGTLKYYASFSRESDYKSKYTIEGNTLWLNLVALDVSDVVSVPYTVSPSGDDEITLTADTQNIEGDIALLDGMEKLMEGNYRRLSFTQEQLETAKELLGVPKNANTEVTQEEPYYWSAGECWVVCVGVYENGEYVAGANFNPWTMEMCNSIYMYAGS